MYNPNFYYPSVSPMGFAGGGNVASRQNYGLAAAAEQLRQRGRGGDTILAHINPQEAGILKSLGGRGTINPRTGLPEFLFGIPNPLKTAERELRNLGSSIDDRVIQPVIGAANDVAEALGPVGQIAAAYFGGPIGAAIYAGFAAPGDDFSLKRAATAAALTYAGGELMGGGSGAGAGADLGGAGYDPYYDFGDVSAVGGSSTVPSGLPVTAPDQILQNIPSTVPPAGAGAAVGAPPVLPDLPAPISYPSGGIDTLAQSTQLAQGPAATMTDVSAGTTGNLGGGQPSMYSLSSGAPQAPVIPNPDYSLATGQQPNLGFQTAGAQGFQAADASMLGQTPSMMDTIKNYIPSGETIKALGPYAQAASLATTGYAALEAKKEQDKYNAEVQRQKDAIEGKKAADKALAEETMAAYPLQYTEATEEDVKNWFKPNYATGGIASFDDETGRDYAGGGIATLPPRYLSGGGDGMSDSIPARIGAKQEARLADGEFVVPADVVSGLGNGSSNAGAKKLYAMMDRVRQARTGKNKQAPQINARRLMPA